MRPHGRAEVAFANLDLKEMNELVSDGLMKALSEQATTLNDDAGRHDAIRRMLEEGGNRDDGNQIRQLVDEIKDWRHEVYMNDSSSDVSTIESEVTKIRGELERIRELFEQRGGTTR